VFAVIVLPDSSQFSPGKKPHDKSEPMMLGALIRVPCVRQE
jgi:hypothetical protein